MKKGMGLRLVALAAVVAAVALAGAVFTQGADAAGPGDTVNVPAAADGSVDGATVTEFNSGANDGIAHFEIDESSTASGSFAYNGGQSISCQDGAKCDADDTDNEVAVKVNVDDDSPNGFIIVNVTDLNAATGGESRELISVNTDDRVVAIDATTPTPNPAISATGADTVTITAKLTNPSEGGVNGKPVVIFTTLGLLDDCGGNADDAGADGVQACSETSHTNDVDSNADTDNDGYVQVELEATSRAGVATVTFTAGDLSDSVTVVFYGAADAIAAEAMQSSISNVNDETFIVVTVTDSGGNPVDDHTIAARSQGADGGDADGDGVVGPGAKAVEVMADYNKDFVHPTDSKKNIPACGDELDDSATTDVDEGARFDGGTGAAGKCVIHVSSTFTDDDNPANDTSRGTNTVHIAGPGATATDTSKDAAVAIQVGGAPAAISSDAPANVDPLSATEVTVSVVDDEGVPVGEVVTSVNQIEGSGRVIAGDGAGMTSDGAVKFTYLAPQTPGTAVFRVTAGEGAGQIASSIVVTIGEMAAEEPPAPTESAVSLDLSAGGNYYSVPANSVPTTASALFDGTSVSVAWKWENGSWTSYIPAIGSTDFLVTSGDILWIVAGSAETVGG